MIHIKNFRKVEHILQKTKKEFNIAEKEIERHQIKIKLIYKERFRGDNIKS